MRTVPVFVALLGMAAPVWAQEALTADEFVRQAVEDNIADGEIGRMVQNDPSLPQGVQQVGLALARSSTRINGALVDIAAQTDVRLSNTPSEQDRQMIQRLSRLEGEEFTREYLQFVINDLERDATFYQEATEIESPEISQLAKETLPVLQTNLAMARKVWDEQVAQAGEATPPSR